MKKAIALVLLALLMLGLFPAAALADGEEPETFYNAQDYVYVLKEDGTAEITGYTGDATKLTVPPELDGHAVTSFKAVAFYNNSKLIEVVIPDTVKSIGNQCFGWCSNLQSVTLPEGLESIGMIPFYYCKKLKKVNIPDSVTAVSEGLFAGCDALREITLSPDHPLLEMVDGVLFNKVDSALLWYPVPRAGQEYAVPEGTKRIGAESFYDTQLQKIVLPDSVEELPEAAFENCLKLKTVNIPSKVASANSVFKSCDKLESINVAEDNANLSSIDGVLFDKVTHTLVKYPAAKRGNAYTVPEGTEAIMNNAFENTVLTQVAIPSSVRFIGGNAFLFCKQLTQIILPEGVEEFGSSPFQWCSNLVKADLPASLTTIKSNPFLRCEKLKEIVIAEGNPALMLVNGCLVLKEDMVIVCCPVGMNEKKLEFPAGIRKIDSSAFNSCAAIEEVIFGDGLEEIATNAFHLCKNLKRIVLPASVIEIDKRAFDLDDMKNTVFVVTAGSYAENFCTSYGLKVQYAG